MTQPRPTRLVIVGGVAGGASAAARARRCDENAEITLIERTPTVSFANCGLPYYIGPEIEDRDKLLVAPAEFLAERFNIDVRTEHEALSIDRDEKSIRVRNQRTGADEDILYDKLILSPGADPIRPPVEGVEAENVATIRYLSDADRARQIVRSDDVRRVAVVGGAYIGLEIAEQLRELGKDVVVVEKLPQVMPALDPELAVEIREELEANGVDVLTGDGLARFTMADGRVTGLVLESGDPVDADAVILAMGVRPTSRLADDAGLELGARGAIVVDEYMRTSDPNVYAVGDAAAYPHALLHAPTPVALGGPANRAGRIAGEHAVTGSARPFTPVLGTSVVRVFSKAAALTGLSEKAARSSGHQPRAVHIRAAHHAGYYPGGEPMTLKLVYAPDGRVLGAQAVGGSGIDKRIDVIATAIRFGATVFDLAGLDLAYAPQFGAAKDPVHMAAFVACNDLDRSDPVAQPTGSFKDVQFVDVRAAAELESLPLDSGGGEARHIPLHELRSRIDELDPSRPTVTVCKSGLRGHVASRILQQHGFANVRNLSGGALLRRQATRISPETVE